MFAIMASRTFLLLNYTFPPNPGVGGRRWAKFARALAEAGHTVHVICVEPYESSTSHWTKDVEHPGIIVHPLAAHYPLVVLRGVNGFADKVKYRLAIKKLERTVKGTIYDKAANWEKPMKELAFSLMDQHNITEVIATGAPFNIPFFAVQWKQERSEIKVYSDLRDPWTTNKHYGMANLSAERKAYEQEKEAAVLAQSDLITVPIEPMLQHYRGLNADRANRMALLPHAYDHRDFEYLPQSSRDGKKRFVYGGTLKLDGMEKVFGKLIETLVNLKSILSTEQFDLLRFDFYTHTPMMQEAVKEAGLEGVINFLKPIPAAQYLAKLGESSFPMIFLSHYVKDWMITKFCEFLPLRKPIMVFSEVGLVSTFVTQNQLGCHFDPDGNDWAESFKKLVDDTAQPWPPFDADFDHRPFSTDQQIQRWLERTDQTHDR